MKKQIYKYTPGPWKYSKMDLGQFRVYNSKQETITSVNPFHHFDHNQKQSEANAKLIAVAPEMHAMLKELATLFETDSDGQFMIHWYQKSKINGMVRRLGNLLKKIEG